VAISFCDVAISFGQVTIPFLRRRIILDAAFLMGRKGPGNAAWGISPEWHGIKTSFRRKRLISAVPQAGMRSS
jgi:hypothetical protein